MPITQDIINAFIDEMKAGIREYANKILKDVLRLVILTVLGVILVAVGLLFILVGAATYIGQLTTMWLGWGLVGLTAALTGLVLLLLRR